MKKAIATSIIAALMCSGCHIDRERYAFRPVPGAVVATDGVTITAEDNSFRLTAGQPFTPPFSQGDNCLLAPASDNYGQAIATGARPVVIDLANGRRLYGLLSLCGAPVTATDPATRSYRIQVPEDYIAATSGGRVSMVFEPFTSGAPSAKAWILWLSETSFAREPAREGGETARTTVVAQMDTAQSLMTFAKWSALIGAASAAVGGIVFASGDVSEGSTIVPGVVLCIVGGLGLIFGISFASSASKQAARVQQQYGALEKLPPEMQLARTRGTAPTVGWGWAF